MTAIAQWVNRAHWDVTIKYWKKQVREYSFKELQNWLMKRGKRGKSLNETWYDMVKEEYDRREPKQPVKVQFT